MKNQMFILLVLTIWMQNIFAQTTITGTVYDSSDHSVLSYTSIGVEGKNIGTVSNAEGNFTLTIPDTALQTDSLTFSYIGYKTVKLKITDILKDSAVKCVIWLQQSNYDLKEITITPDVSKTKPMKIGWNSSGLHFLTTPFFTNSEIKHGDHISREKGVLLNCKYNCKVNSLHFFILRNGYKNVKFRLSFYAVTNGIPTSLLINEDIIFDVSNHYKGWFVLDLSKYNIYLKPGEFAATLTLLEDEREEGKPDWFILPATLLSKYKTIERNKAMGNWTKLQGMFSFYLSVTAYLNDK